MDDGSSDDSPAILEEFARKDSRIRILTQQNAGAGAARNLGMKYAKGRYLSFLDSDDFFEPDMLEKSYEKAEEYQAQIVKNAAALAEALKKRGYGLVSGGTDNHLILIDLRKSHPDLTGKDAQNALDKANITTNKNTVPGETRSPFKASGIRLGTPAVTSRGMVEADMEKIAEAIDMVLSNPSDESQIAKAKEIALELCKTHPLPY